MRIHHTALDSDDESIFGSLYTGNDDTPGGQIADITQELDEIAHVPYSKAPY